ncbi:hypothetical protein [Arthrobacter sp. NA-172]|uniref:hypothetical protein n=1 Tax=Arthrobacter sp. NA-172 TaxID=3367524 RepID=UPI003753F4D1
MGVEPTSNPEEPVHDGVQDRTDPVPKESGGPSEDRPLHQPDERPADFGNVSGGEADGPSGPAEDQDDAGGDDRGLTTDLAPSD